MKVKQLGHVVLRVRDAEASAQWYQDLLGLKVTYRIPGRMVFLSAGSQSSHELALMTLGPDAPPPEENRIGLYHVGWELDAYEDWVEFGKTLERKGIEPVGVGDHGVSIGTYLHDPDGNELEVFYELPREEWPGDGRIFEGHFPHPVSDGQSVRSGERSISTS